ncbi:MAG: recombinase family protein [Ruminococcus sp.]|nr:recombinase family protein [Ruminococcus sp.]
MKKITVIYPKPPTEIIRLKKVAAYCRVSTKQEIQERSLEVQKAYFHESIPKKPDWIFVGVYADEASGRHNKKMKDFQRMMRDCRDGKIDLILVKSISRLGRNTVQLLYACSELNRLGADVYFEVEKLHINDPEAIKTLTIYACLYQNESQEKSHNVRWSFKARFIEGSSGFADRVCYGYTHDENGKFIADPARAEIVRAIFAWHKDGLSLRAITAELKEHGIPSPRGNPVWHIETVRKILNNEKYYGDVLLQKTYVSDCFTGKQSLNNGELDKYLIEGHHEGIVSKPTKNDDNII